MPPGVPAGSNHVGARVIVPANVTRPSGAAARPSGVVVCAGASAVTVSASDTTIVSTSHERNLFIEPSDNAGASRRPQRPSGRSIHPATRFQRYSRVEGGALTELLNRAQRRGRLRLSCEVKLD